MRTVELPPPQFPMLLLLLTDQLVSSTGSDPLEWSVGKAHPFVPELKIIRMFIDDRGGVEVYSISNDGKGVRDFVPMRHVRLVQEAMPLDVFVSELAAAESGAEDDEDDDIEPEPEPVTAPPNGQPTS